MGIKSTAQVSHNKITEMEGLIDANVHFLEQGERLLESLDDGEYAAPDEGLYGSSIGQHVRHCLDHYLSFLKGVPQGEIDYDCRERLGETECLTDCALTGVREIREALLEIKKGEAATGDFVKVRMDCGGVKNDWQGSTLARELQFLVSHTVHHYAMINGMARRRGISIEKKFGFAPSTLKYRESASID